MSKKNLLLSNEQGFTLVEIIAVLVILGILAAVATPKFIDLQDDARQKAAEAAIAEVQARLSLSYGKYLLANSAEPTDVKQVCNATSDTTILPTDCAATDYAIGDYLVDLAASGTTGVTIDVESVDGVDVTVTQVTWTLP